MGGAVLRGPGIWRVLGGTPGLGVNWMVRGWWALREASLGAGLSWLGGGILGGLKGGGEAQVKEEGFGRGGLGGFGGL